VGLTGSEHYVRIGGREYKVDYDTLVDWIKSGKIRPHDLIRSYELTANVWKRAADTRVFDAHKPRRAEKRVTLEEPYLLSRDGISPVMEPGIPPEPAWLFYVLSLLFPSVGVIIGAIFTPKSSEVESRFGKNCLVAGIISTVLYFLCYCLIPLTSLFSIYY
jgi:hypothetical protein